MVQYLLPQSEFALEYSRVAAFAKLLDAIALSDLPDNLINPAKSAIMVPVVSKVTSLLEAECYCIPNQ